MNRQRPTAFFDDERPWCPDLVVYEDAPEPIDTGILDASGTKIFRRPERRRIGFDLSEGKR